MILEEDRLILHDLRGVNLKVDFFLGTRKEFIEQTKCIQYSVCYESVDVRVDQLTYTEPLYDLDFHFNTQQLFIDDHIISGEVLSFYCERANNGILTASCKMLIGRDY
jgi:hypothetical protein